MRYYKLKFYTRGGTVIGGNGFNAMGPVIPFEYSSVDALNRPLPGALDIQFDVTTGLLGALQGPTTIRIFNPPLDVVKNAPIYQDMKVTLEMGFIRGLPMASRLYALTHGIVGAFGSVANSFANYVGTDMALDLVVIPSVWFGNPYTSRPGVTGATVPQVQYPEGISAPNSPRGFNFIWEPKESFFEAVKKCLASAGFTVDNQCRITPNLLNNTPKENYATSFTSLQQFAIWLQGFSRDQVNPPTINGLQKYSGVKLSLGNNNLITLFDGTETFEAIKLAPEDFIGQPTWQTYPEIIQTVHPLRPDLSINRILQFPPSIPNALSPPSGGTIYANGFLRGVTQSVINQVRHVGRFRDPSQSGWVSVVNSTQIGFVP